MRAVNVPKKRILVGSCPVACDEALETHERRDGSRPVQLLVPAPEARIAALKQRRAKREQRRVRLHAFLHRAARRGVYFHVGADFPVNALAVGAVARANVRVRVRILDHLRLETS